MNLRGIEPLCFGDNGFSPLLQLKHDVAGVKSDETDMVYKTRSGLGLFFVRKYDSRAEILFW